MKATEEINKVNVFAEIAEYYFFEININTPNRKGVSAVFSEKITT